MKHGLGILELLYPNVRFKMPDILSEDENPYLGSLNFNNREVGVFGGFGDVQPPYMAQV